MARTSLFHNSLLSTFELENDTCDEVDWTIDNWKDTNSLVSTLKLEEDGCGEVKWTINNWKDTHTLCDGTITLNKSKGKVVEVIDPFLYFESRIVDQHGQLGDPGNCGLIAGHSVTNLKITIKAELFRLLENGNKAASVETGNTVASVETVVEESLLAEAEESLISDLKNMFVAYENFTDLKLESSDHMTLDAHKFILAARSQYLRKCIEDAVKTENFNGTMKIDINGKPLVVILHWMYTGELHENAGNVMEEVVAAAILFELTHLMKILDRKLATICNKENMFRLYQVAQKNAMPKAMDEISAYIRENL